MNDKFSSQSIIFHAAHNAVLCRRYPNGSDWFFMLPEPLTNKFCGGKIIDLFTETNTTTLALCVCVCVCLCVGGHVHAFTRILRPTANAKTNVTSTAL